MVEVVSFNQKDRWFGIWNKLIIFFYFSLITFCASWTHGNNHATDLWKRFWYNDWPFVLGFNCKYLKNVRRWLIVIQKHTAGDILSLDLIQNSSTPTSKMVFEQLLCYNYLRTLWLVILNSLDNLKPSLDFHPRCLHSYGGNRLDSLDR